MKSGLLLNWPGRDRSRRASVSISAATAAQSKPPLAIDGDAAARPWKRYKGWPARDESKFNTLANLASPPAPTAPRKLTGRSRATRRRAQKLVADRNRGGSCLACHVMGPAGGADLPGNVGPDLSEIGNAGRDDEWLFNYVYDARVYNRRHGDAALGHPRSVQRRGNWPRRRVPEDPEGAREVQERSRRPDQAPAAGRDPRQSRLACQSWHVGGRESARSVEGERAGRHRLRRLPCEPGRRSRPGRPACRNGSRASTRCSASRSSSPATPRRRPATSG